ncbi:hypothetical protein [Anthocerotibacter panamensis]|uniref:hypothetical protein n=1 Tax=Anthocerotibacter panamensis TaxID=2857077 RepID=UPI001C401622|nr:hypothetical protein [Anthocerotibacter panamensis]
MIETNNSLHLNRDYACPVCRLGRLSAMSLMEVLACSLCRHMFAVDLDSQMVGLIGAAPPLVWQWDGRAWATPHGQGLSRADSWAAVALVVFPTALIGGSAYIFRGSTLDWFAIFWTGLTFVSHLVCVLAVLVTYYQLSVWTLLKSLGRLVGFRNF